MAMPSRMQFIQRAYKHAQYVGMGFQVHRRLVGDWDGLHAGLYLTFESS